MKKIVLSGLFILSLSAIALTACKKEVKDDVSSLYTKETAQTLPAETSTEATTEERTSEVQTKTASVNPVVNQDKEYVKNNTKATYPIFSGLSSNEEKVNQKIEKNLTSFIGALGLDNESDNLTLTYSILSADSKRIAVQYEGSYTKGGENKKLFFTNTIDTLSGKDIGLNQIADISTLADYILSDEVELVGADSKVRNAFYEQRNSIRKEEYISLLENADFPLKTGTDGKVISLPQSFSYSKSGDIYFTLPADYADTGYILIKFTPSTK